MPVSKTVVVNRKYEEFDVYIGRPSPLGNQFSAKLIGRGPAISEYKKWFEAKLVASPEFKKYVESLKGKRLGCWCKPMSCHGDVVVAYLERKPDAEVQE